jgi:hypothetical protein
MSETQCLRLNVRYSMSESDLRTWSRIFATTRTWVYNLIFVNEWIVDLSCSVFHSWCAARHSVNAYRLLTASMSRVVVFSTEVQSFLVLFETLVGHLHGTRGGAIMMVVRRICGSLSVYEDRLVDMTVVKLTLIDLSE